MYYLLIVTVLRYYLNPAVYVHKNQQFDHTRVRDSSGPTIIIMYVLLPRAASFGPIESTTQRAYRSLQLALQSSRSWQTDRQTTRYTPSVTIGRIYVRIVLPACDAPMITGQSNCYSIGLAFHSSGKVHCASPGRSAKITLLPVLLTKT